MFAKPFIGQLGRGHVDGVYTMAKDPEDMTRFASGSGDGVVKVWDVTTRDEVWQTKAHENIVKGTCWSHDGKLLTCGGVDRTVALHDPYNTPSESKPLTTYPGRNAFTSLSHHRHEPTFAASHSAGISIYDITRTTPSSTLTWPTSVDTITSTSFSQVETSLLCSSATDRALLLHDLRTPSTPIARTVLSLATNAIAWSPMEAFNLAAANEDHNIYLFDVRNFSRFFNASPYSNACLCLALFTPLLSEAFARHNLTFPSSDPERSGVKSARQRQALEYGEALKKRLKFRTSKR